MDISGSDENENHDESLDDNLQNDPSNSILKSNSIAILQIVDLVINGLTSEHSRRVYSTALFEFLTWYEDRKSVV